MKNTWQRMLSSIHTFKVLYLVILFCISCSFARQDSDNKNITGLIAMQSEQNDATPEWKKEAKDMVFSQLISRGITDQNVLRVMENTPRHLFVPESIAESAYIDRPLPIGEGQTIS
jgi:hypothetical protein